LDNIEKKEKELKKKNHLFAYDLLKSFANWLDDPNNEVFNLLEFDDNSLSVAANANVLAAAILRKAALDIQLVSGIEDTNKYDFNVSDALDSLVSMANEFDNSNNPDLIKKANLIDEIILTMSSTVEEQEKFKYAMDKKIEDIKKRSRDSVDKKKIKASIDDTENGSYRPLQAPLSSRSFPGSPGTPMVRVREGVYYNIDTGEQIDFNSGYNLNNKKVPGTSVENQTENLEGVKIPTQFK
jgi:hypothetical protein